MELLSNMLTSLHVQQARRTLRCAYRTLRCAYLKKKDSEMRVPEEMPRPSFERRRRRRRRRRKTSVIVIAIAIVIAIVK